MLIYHSVSLLLPPGCVELSEEGLKSLGQLKELRRLNLIEASTTDAVLLRLHGASHLMELAVGTQPYRGPYFTTETLAE